MVKAKRLTLDDLNFFICAEREDITPKQSMKGSSPEEMKAFCDAVEQVRKVADGAWGWCCVKVTGVLKSHSTFSACEYLGCCSYASKQQFIEISGYYDGMRMDILAEVQGQLDKQAELINKSISSGIFMAV